MWQPLLVVTAMASLVLTVLNWTTAYAGVAVNVAILLMLWLGPYAVVWLKSKG